MVIDLPAPDTSRPWERSQEHWPAVLEATRGCGTPLAVLDLAALAANAAALVRRAAGRPIRLASKSLRVRSVLEAVLRLPGFHGVMAYTLSEALWLATSVDDVLVGYPTTDRAGLAALATSDLHERITLMVDSIAHLDLIDSVVPPRDRPELRVAIELDLSVHARVLGRLGVLRSPISDTPSAIRLAETIARRPGFRLVGVMAYEAQIAGVPDAYPGRPVYAAAVRLSKRRSLPELAARREQVVAAVRGVSDLEFVNGGGTGSIETTVAETAVTEVAAGSGLFAGHLFDRYAAFRPSPAAVFALPVVRLPAPGVATVSGGGWIASGPAGADRNPLPIWPSGLRYEAREQAGEVQTPLRGPATAGMAIGDRVLFRHAKSGELAEHANEFHLLRDGSVDETALTYRGEGRAFL